MPKKIQKSLQDYLSKIKSTPRSHIHLPSKKWILRGCKHPRTPSFSMDDKKNKAHGTSNNDNNNNNNNNKKNDDEATLADVDRFLFENFRSLYLRDDDGTHNINTKRISDGKSQKPGCTWFDSLEEPPPVGFSRLLLETTTTEVGSSSSASTTPRNHDDDSCSKEKTTIYPENCVAVLAPCATKSPYEEFKRSMEGVVEERLRNDEKVDWDFMEELLSCYMNMNEKKSHKFILAAFVDVITLMRRPLLASPAKPRSVRTVTIGREIKKKTKQVTLEFENCHACENEDEDHGKFQI